MKNGCVTLARHEQMTLKLGAGKRAACHWTTSRSAAHLYCNGRCKLEDISICDVLILVRDTLQKIDSTLKTCSIPLRQMHHYQLPSALSMFWVDFASPIIHLGRGQSC